MDMHGETISVPTFYLLSQHKQKTYNIITMALGVIGLFNLSLFKVK